MVGSEQVRVLEKAREVVRLQWACVAAACGFLGLQVVFGGWWWSVSVLFAVVVAVLVLVHFRYVRQFDALASGRSARWRV
ncbi:hypothetical protein ACWDTG_24705 [Rhodococcus zopfii]|uniref:hypothetical protein n=1 Tax=Rhodococcus zopfii TaxID=43772 RepID=UPI00365A71AB